MIDWLAICIPIYPPHYEYAYRFLEKTSNLFPIYFVFSSQEDYELFERKDIIHPLIYPVAISNGNDSIINRKKLFALHSLQNSSYTYILILDAETDFLRESFEEKRFLQAIESFFTQKRIYGKTITGSRHYRQIVQIMKTCAESMPPEVFNCILKETDNFTIYTWWSDLPLYKREDLPDFLSKLEAQSISWFHFDHILYSYYLLGYHNFTIFNLEPYIQDPTVFFEDYIPDEEFQVQRLHELGVQYMYVRYSLYTKFSKLFDKFGSLFLFHLNR